MRQETQLTAAAANTTTNATHDDTIVYTEEELDSESTPGFDWKQTDRSQPYWIKNISINNDCSQITDRGGIREIRQVFECCEGMWYTQSSR